MLTLYKSKLTNETMVLMSVKNKTDKDIQLSATDIAFNNHPNFDVNSTYSEFNNTYYINFMIPEEYCKTDEVTINFDLVYNHIDSEESVTIPIGFTTNTEIKDVIE